MGLQRLRLWTQLTVAVVALLLMVLAILWSSYVAQRREQQVSGVQDSMRFAQSIAANLERFLQDVEGTGATIALALRDKGALEQESIMPFLASIQSEYAPLHAIFITDLTGRTIVSQAPERVGGSVPAAVYPGSEVGPAGRLE
jgi:C4-dicarboxylate-specific signal transduction histidine kinase